MNVIFFFHVSFVVACVAAMSCVDDAARYSLAGFLAGLLTMGVYQRLFAFLSQPSSSSRVSSPGPTDGA